MTYRADDYIAFWDGINAIVRASGGSDACTNVARQKAVVDVERALGNLCKADREPLVQAVIELSRYVSAFAVTDANIGEYEAALTALNIAVQRLAEWKP